MKLNRRDFLASVGGSALAAALAPQSAVADGHMTKYNLLAGRPFGGTKLNILSVVTPQFRGLELRSDEFTSLTGIETEWTYIPIHSLQEKINAEGLAANGNFDVVNYLDSWGPPNAYWLQPIDDLLARDGIDMNRYPEAFKRSAMYEGRTLGFPMRAHGQLLFYRKDLIETPPSSWEELVALGQDMLKRSQDICPLAMYYGNDCNRQNLFIWLNFIWAAGGDIFNDDWTAAWTSEEALEATEDYVGLVTERHGVATPDCVSFNEQDARQSFMQGKSAMTPQWWWAYSLLKSPDNSTLTEDQVAFAPLPTYKGNLKSYAISMPYSISQYTRHPEASWEFMKWLSNPDMEKRNATEREVKGEKIVNNVVTHIENLTDPEVNEANDHIQAAVWRGLENSDIMPQISEWPEVGDLLSAAITEGAAGGNVRRLMIDAANQSDRVLKRAGRIE